MKKLFLSCAFLTIAILAQAQTKIAPKLTKGFKAVYTEVTTANVAGVDQKTSTETRSADSV